MVNCHLFNRYATPIDSENRQDMVTNSSPVASHFTARVHLGVGQERDKMRFVCVAKLTQGELNADLNDMDLTLASFSGRVVG